MCTCQDCGTKYKVDVMVSKDLWRQITPKPETEGSGLLCPKCIGERLEEISDYASYKLIEW